MKLRGATGVLLAGVLAWSPSDAGEPAPIGFLIEAGLSAYTSSDDLTVFSPWGRAQQQVDERVLISAGWKADAISAASVDVVSQATEPFDELRNEGQLAATLDLTEFRASLSYTGSFESDTTNHTISGGAEIDLLERNLTLGLRYGIGLDAMGTVHEPRALWRDRMLNQVDASVTQVLGPSTIGSVIYTFQHTSGFLSSPYRMVPIFPRGEETHTRESAQWLAERHPDARTRHSVTLGLKHALTQWLFLRGSYRLYLDTWAMRAHTGELGVTVDLGEGVTLAASERFHWQSSVSFYRPVYTVSRDFMTRDHRLAKLMSSLSALTLRFELPLDAVTIETLLRGELHWNSDADFRTMRDDQYVPIEDTIAFVGQAGLSLGF